MALSEEEKEYVEKLEAAYQRNEAENNKMANAQMSAFTLPSEDNLIKWQLDLTEDKDKIYHLLRGDKIVETDGEVSYQSPKNIREIPFNDYGVGILMQIINYYLTKNTILSNYSIEEINMKVHDFGINISDYIHNNYHELIRIPNHEEAHEILIKKLREKRKNIQAMCKDFFGKEADDKIVTNILLKEVSPEEEIMKNYDILESKIRELQQDYLSEKLKLYPIIIEALVNTVHSVYLRALNGGERESLRTARTVTQTEPVGSFNRPQLQQNKKFSMLKPGTWT